ncbi:MAG: polyribonucleotide nucleotidyltransferase [Candidatus Caenarcaniphilales bacterium]|jgi:polyribonucleotide nucleotidyltransferase|nr:polyribonucleotide nucleotidyltransferase [Candidatus Caenarcaniphilales bacterium]
MLNEKKISFEIAGNAITVSTGKLAKQATGSVEIRCKNTALLVTVVAAEKPRDGIDFFPLTVDYEEKLYSVGRIPGSYNRREGRASDKSILISRLIDRPVRPLFQDGFRNDVQINVITLSIDNDCPPDTLAMLGAAFALELSGLPLDGPFGAVRISLDDAGNFVINPTEVDQQKSDLDVVIAGTADSIMMVEAGCNFVEDNKVVDAIAYGHKFIQEQITYIKKFAQECGVVKQEFVAAEAYKPLCDLIEKEAKEDIIASMQNATKASRKAILKQAQAKVDAAIVAAIEASGGKEGEFATYLAKNPFALGEAMKKFEKKLLRKQIKETKVRADGRNPLQVRNIFCETGSYPNVHGDGLFTRGDTQVLSLAVLGTEKMARELDDTTLQDTKYYMHNYNFPSWSVGEARPNRGPGRREVGHGALAERAIEPALPSRETFPYSIRVVSEVLESAGSTSMASTCASSLSLFDAGVPMKTAVAGVAMGLIQEGDEAIVLTDIHELEDFLGDMDFKVAGNEAGISALQMDIKIKGIAMDTLRRAIGQAKEGRLHILGKMLEIAPKPRPEMRPNAPRITQTRVETDRIGAVIGPSGKNIKAIIELTGVEIDINDTGAVNIFSTNEEAAQKALMLVHASANGLQAGEIWEGKVVKVLDGIGAIVEIFGGNSGLVHISQIANERVNNVADYVSVGDMVTVRVQGTDAKGRTSLSMKEVEQAVKA